MEEAGAVDHVRDKVRRPCLSPAVLRELNGNPTSPYGNQSFTIYQPSNLERILLQPNFDLET